MQIWLNIYYGDEGVLTFAPDKVLDKIEEFFPQVEIDPTDYGWEEVEKITDFANERIPEERRAGMILQIHGKYRRNSPSYKFKITTGDETEINGHARRYNVRFACEKNFDEETEKKIIELLQSLKYGELSSDTKTEYFCKLHENSETKWVLKN